MGDGDAEGKHGEPAVPDSPVDSVGELATRHGALPPSSDSTIAPNAMPSIGAPTRPESALKREGADPVSWRDLPHKGQLVVITLARLSEPLVQTSLQSYMFYQLKWFDPSLPDSVISTQAGILQYVLPVQAAAPLC